MSEIQENKEIINKNKREFLFNLAKLALILILVFGFRNTKGNILKSVAMSILLVISLTSNFSK